MKRWPIKPLGEICEFVRGITFKPTDLVEAGSPDSLACFRTKNIQVTLEADDLIHIPRSFVKTDRQLVREGDTLISTANSNKLVGKCCFVPHIDYSATLGGFIVAVRSDQKQIKPRFLYYWLTSSLIQDRLRGLARQTTNISNLPVTDVAKEPAPVPPLAEQERIVKLLDEADELRKLRAQSDRRTATLIPALFHEMFGDIQTNRCRFPVLELGSLCKVLGGGTPSKQKSDYWIGKIPWVSPKDMSGDEVHDSEDHISEQAVKESATNLVPQGAVLVVTRSGILKHTLPVAINSVLVTINQDIKAFVPSAICDATFLAAQLRVLAPTILSLVRVGATVQNIETETLKQLPVLNPPLALQKEFAARVTEIRAMQTEQSASRKRLDDLFQSMLHRAFEGEL